MTDKEHYNYPHFPDHYSPEPFESFKNLLHVGDEAPDGPVVRLQDQEQVAFSNWWSDKPLVVEFGSVT